MAAAENHLTFKANYQYKHPNYLTLPNVLADQPSGTSRLEKVAQIYVLLGQKQFQNRSPRRIIIWITIFFENAEDLRF